VSANLFVQWLVVGAAVLWAAWLISSRLGLFAWLPLRGRKHRAESAPSCPGCKACGPSKGMEKLLEETESEFRGKL